MKYNAKWGAIIGDVLGSVYEDPICPYKTDDPSGIDLFREDVFFTDDTVLTVAVMDALNNGSDAFGKYLRKWAQKYPRAGYGKKSREWLMRRDPWYAQNNPNSDGNGAAMRISPIAMIDLKRDAFIETMNDSIWLTHDSENGKKWAMTLGSVIKAAYISDPANAPLSSIIDDGVYPSKSVAELRKEVGFSTEAAQTVPLAIRCAVEAESFEDAARLAISLGSDTDTVCSMACAITGAFYGIREELVNFVRKRLTLELISVVNEFQPN